MECVRSVSFPALFFAVYSDDGPMFRSMNEPVREPVCKLSARLTKPLTTTRG